ncbi:NAD(P)H-hydrate dehydratase [Marinobacter changyiensis]|uniref:NAD(P)H-hydrate dehydratase n=1 Tax=Marinobacter changyiensis TaxID=2604091 RepID=UPI00126553DB|nr:NAD(P)H-hydrate dehydratase [Marinobacter changyiensis]
MSLPKATSLTETLYSADAVRAIDGYIINKSEVSGFELMQRAAGAAFRRLMKQWPDVQQVVVFCGAGNNGGDGYLVAANAKRHGLEVRCVAVSAPEKLKGDADSAYQKALADGVEVTRWERYPEDARAELFRAGPVIVDAMLGTGVTGEPRQPFRQAIEACNQSGCAILAVDVPSGLDATTGATPGAVIKADVTVTFIALKAGLYIAQGPEFSGLIHFEPLVDALDGESHGQSGLAVKFDWDGVQSMLPRRPVTAHKGRFGHLLVVAGDRGFGGAGLLAAEAAARTGAGLVTLATRPEHVSSALARCPSLMVHGVTHGSELSPLIEAADAIVCGPGLGKAAWGQQMLQLVLASGKPLVLDADALNLMALRVAMKADNHVLTPHPGEAARLLGLTVPEIEADRVAAARHIQRQFGGTVLLKGAGTVVDSGEELPGVLGGSNPGMATGGMGDVLSGVLGGLLVQGLGLPDSTRLAAALHLAAANRAAMSKGYMGLLPTDIIDTLPTILGEAEGSVVRAIAGGAST